MLLTINLPNRDTALASNRQRWAEVLSDETLSENPYRIETNVFGQIIMSPPASGSHSSRQGNLVYELRQRFGGQVNPECPISTSDGVKATDVGAFSQERYQLVRGQLAFEIAPEICVEILSPRNTLEQIENRFKLFFEAGALECWQCDLEGRMTYRAKDDPRTATTTSSLCPSFPSHIAD